MVPSSPNVIDLSRHAVARHLCRGHLCDSDDITDPIAEQLDGIIRHRRPIRRGAVLFNAGDPFHALYVVHSGAVKTFTFTGDGDEQITGFHMAGALVGMDGIHQGTYWSSAAALDSVSVCEVPFEKLEALAQQVPGLLHRLLCVMSREILHDEATLLLLGKKTAEQRLASLLVSFAGRFGRRGYVAREFSLPMSRDDIGNYLGMAHETVSRLFSRFQRQGLVTARGKRIWIGDFGGLRMRAGLSVHRPEDGRDFPLPG